MGRWLIGLLLGLAALGAVFFLWRREGTLPAPAPGGAETAMDHPMHEAPAEGPSTAAIAPESAPTPAQEMPDPNASAEGIIVVDEPWARPGSAGGTTAAYMLMTNAGQAADRIVSVSSPDAAEASIHETKMDAKNVASMRPASHVDLDPGVPLVFEPGGLHVMLTGLKHRVKDGDAITLVFLFQHAGTLRVQIPVGELTTDGDSVQP